MPNSKQIVYLSQSQYAELIANGTITVDGVTVTYDENDIYVTPQAEPVTDVRVNNVSVAANGVANIPIGNGLYLNNGALAVSPANSTQIKQSIVTNRPIPPYAQDASTFYGLAKVAGHDEKNSAEPLGTYTPEAKGAIQSMLGVSDLIATAENNLVASKAYAVGDVFTANGKLYKATAAIAADAAIIPAVEGEEVAGANCVETSVGEGFVKFTDYANAHTAGVVVVGSSSGLYINPNSGVLQVSGASRNNEIKSGSNLYKPIVPYTQDMATFYGLAKAAGADEKDSTLPVGQYTDTAKSAIRSMIGASSTNVIAVQDTQPTDTDTKIWLPETAETPVEVPTVAEMNTALSEKVDDVQVNGVSVVQDGVANIPIATNGYYGLVKPTTTYGVNIINGYIGLRAAIDTQIKESSAVYATILPNKQYVATFYGLAKAAGDTT